MTAFFAPGALTSGKTPQEQGYRMPAEWERHEATWLAWPHNPEDWPGKFQTIPWVYAEIVRLLSARERVHILVDDAKAERHASGILERDGANLDRVSFHLWPTDRVWTRDSGPIFVRKDGVRNGEGQLAVTNWQFNAWAKYPDWHLDDQVPGRVTELLGLPEWQPVAKCEDGFLHRLVLEGGSIDTNGEGILLTTEECLLSDVQQRNPGVSRAQLEQAFHKFLGIDQVLWLSRGIAGDDTHGHVDDISRFVAPTTIVTAVEPNKSDPNHEHASRPRAPWTTSSSLWWSCRCRGRWSSTGSVCRPAMPTSILPMNLSWFLPSMTPMTASLSTFWPRSFRTEKSSASIA
jgi:agmatine deiminase